MHIRSSVTREMSKKMEADVQAEVVSLAVIVGLCVMRYCHHCRHHARNAYVRFYGTLSYYFTVNSECYTAMLQLQYWAQSIHLRRMKMPEAV